MKIKSILLLSSFIIAISASAQTVSPELELSQIYAEAIVGGVVTPTPRVEAPIVKTQIESSPARFELSNGKAIIFMPEKLDRNSTYKVLVETNGELQRLRVPNCDSISKNDTKDLVTGSYTEFINYKNRAYAVQTRLSAGAAVVYVDTYKISLSEFGTGVEICFKSTMFQEYAYNEATGKSELTPWKRVDQLVNP